jgi:hypothetical protein
MINHLSFFFNRTGVYIPGELSVIITPNEISLFQFAAYFKAAPFGSQGKLELAGLRVLHCNLPPYDLIKSH